MQAAVKFIEVFDCLNMYADDPSIGNVKPPLEEIYMILKKVCNKLGAEFTMKFKDYERMLASYVQSRNINESLTESELREIKLNL